MKSAIIYGEYEYISYFIIEQDMSRFEGVYGNSMSSPQELQEELFEIMFNAEGYFKHPKVTIKELETAIREGAILVECGFIP